MNKLIVIIMAMCVFAGVAAAQVNTDLSVSGLYYAPDDDDTYDYGLGAEVQARFWLADQFGFALAAGVASWEANEESYSLSDGFETLDLDIDGDVFLLPLGGSILFKPEISDQLSLVLEGGIRYVLVESNVDVDAEYFDGIFTTTLKDEVEIDDGLIGVVGATLEIEVSSSISLLGGIGYQFDLSEGDAEFEGVEIGENELEAFFARAGLVLDF